MFWSTKYIIYAFYISDLIIQFRNAISIWNTTYLQKAIDHLKQSCDFDESLLKHISPLGWEHINLLGEYHFDVKNALESDELRPLNINNL